MDFYVSNNAIEELNTCGKTKILDENGNEIVGYISVRGGRPKIFGLFGCGETIWLDKLELYEGCLRGWLTTHDRMQCIDFHFHLHNGDHIIEWTYKE